MAETAENYARIQALQQTNRGNIMALAQCTALIAKIDCQFNTTKGRPWKVKTGQEFWVTSPIYKNAAGCYIDRKGKGCSNSGLYLTIDQLQQVFDV